uniref:Methionyl-tRNA synthetase n=1 Tax=Triatoma infestans TaxID=30076 RepID=A0A170ZJF0_TRIIF
MRSYQLKTNVSSFPRDFLSYLRIMEIKYFPQNIASNFLFRPPLNLAEKVDVWLYWDGTKLQPALVELVGKADVVPSLKKLFCELELALEGKNFIVEEVLTVADVCLWGTLFPVLTDENLSKTLLSDTPNIKRWWHKLNERQEWKIAQDRFKLKPGLLALQSVSASCWYPEFSSANNSSERKLKQSNSIQENSVENHLSEDHSEFKEIILSEEQIANAVSNWNKSWESRQKLKKGF